MDWLTEPFALAFQQRALAGGALAAITTSVVGTWVVLRGMAFMGDALVHGVIPGIALAVLVGFDPILGAVAAAVVMIGGINVVHRQTRFGDDTGIGLLFVGMLALGVVLVSRSDAYAVNLTSILFGDALGVTTADLTLLGSITLAAVSTSALLYRPFLTLSFHADKARLVGMFPAVSHASLLALITLAVVGSFRTVGTLLVLGLLLGPPATAALLVRRVPTMMVTAAVAGVLAVVTGLVLSYHLDTAASATIAGVSIAGFFVVLGLRSASRAAA